ncbi:MAG: OmpA family protein [Kiritimatiellia bacterium]
MSDSTHTTDSGAPRERLLNVPVAELNLAPNAPKILQAPETLTQSVGTYGILQPLLVRPGADGYEVVAGFKRLQAAKSAGLTEVPVRVYRVEDEALEGLFNASNVRSEARNRVSLPPMGEYKPNGKLSGLLEEELNRTPGDVPYKSIMTVAVTILLLIWGGIALKKHLPWGGTPPPPAATPTPEPVRNERAPLPPVSPDRPGSPAKVSLARWRLLLMDVGGIEVRDESGVPRIVFSDPVFSRLTTIDPAQKTKLDQIARIVRQANASAVLTIIGHTDNDPIRPSSEYRSNEYLSELRAREVVNYLAGTGTFPPAQLRPIAMGAQDPPFPNSSAASKAKNRTVSIEIMQPVN